MSEPSPLPGAQLARTRHRFRFTQIPLPSRHERAGSAGRPMEEVMEIAQAPKISSAVFAAALVLVMLVGTLLG